jgi:dipeptidyl aminopeptidase/acylaminoacyl peptidase
MTVFKQLLMGATALAFLPAAAPPADPAKLFGARESVSSIDLSPDGKRLAHIQPAGGPASAVLLTELESGTSKRLTYASGNKEGLDWCGFASASQLVCRASGAVADGATLIGWSRLLMVPDDGTAPKSLGQSGSHFDARIRQYDGALIDWLPDDQGSVLLSREYVPEAGRTGSHIARTADGLGVDRINLKTLKSNRVEQPRKGAAAYITDGRGNVRIMRVDEQRGDQGMLTGRTIYHYRKSGASGWDKLSEEISGEGLIPIAVDGDSNSAFALRKLNGRYALYRVKLDGSLATELVYAHDRVDVDNVVRIGRSGRVIGVTFAEEKREVIYFDPEYKKLQAALGKAIPHLPLIQFSGASADGQKLLIFAGSDSDPGRYFAYEKGSRSLRELMLVRPELEGVPLASVKHVSYPAADGTSIPGYLTLPVGKEAKNLPAVVLPHGGPSARDEWGFDWLAQYLAHLGYAVLQPNYRGSAGYGDPWLNENGFKGWRTSIGDVTAGAKWLSAQGIADPARVSIVGWSYGGYAALQAAATEPDLFKAVVAIAPVTDLAQLKEEAMRYTSGNVVARFVGDGPHVREGSPAQNAERIAAPVLIFHGTGDQNVDVAQARTMDKALRGAGKKSNVVIYPELAHDLDDSNARTDMLGKIATFLAANGAR